MKSKDILTELREISVKETISKNELIPILKKYAAIISTYDLMLASARMRRRKICPESIP